MGAKTKIDWCDSTWNPVTGCLHGCEYCYARRIAKRFGMHLDVDLPELVKKGVVEGPADSCVLDEPVWIPGQKVEPYPFDFLPTYHRYKLDEPQYWKKPKTIFVCSMADLFGEWVPDEWIQEVFEACGRAPQHRYLFLTKNPGRYCRLAESGKLPQIKDAPNFWYGISYTDKQDFEDRSKWFETYSRHVFISVEPILDDLRDFPWQMPKWVDWVIVGAETGNRKGKVTPKREWIERIVNECAEIKLDDVYVAKTPVFMKESLRELMGEDFRQEFPWEVDTNARA